MITERELYAVVAREPNVKATFDRAIDAVTQLTRAKAKPGLWAKVKLAPLTLGYTRSLSNLLASYGAATGIRHPASDIDRVAEIVLTAAKNPDRSFILLLLAMTGDWPNEQKPDQLKGDRASREDDLPDIEVAS